LVVCRIVSYFCFIKGFLSPDREALLGDFPKISTITGLSKLANIPFDGECGIVGFSTFCKLRGDRFVS
jgi:hypothetical protein